MGRFFMQLLMYFACPLTGMIAWMFRDSECYNRYYDYDRGYSNRGYNRGYFGNGGCYNRRYYNNF